MLVQLDERRAERGVRVRKVGRGSDRRARYLRGGREVALLYLQLRELVAEYRRHVPDERRLLRVGVLRAGWHDGVRDAGRHEESKRRAQLV